MEFKGLISLIVLLTAVTLYVMWAAGDAHRRGKSAILVCLAVVFFFPFGLIAWLLFRPARR
jgi:hypothetical protein